MKHTALLTLALALATLAGCDPCWSYCDDRAWMYTHCLEVYQCSWGDDWTIDCEDADKPGMRHPCESAAEVRESCMDSLDNCDSSTFSSWWADDLADARADDNCAAAAVAVGYYLPEPECLSD